MKLLNLYYEKEIILSLLKHVLQGFKEKLLQSKRFQNLSVMTKNIAKALCTMQHTWKIDAA